MVVVVHIILSKQKETLSLKTDITMRILCYYALVNSLLNCDCIPIIDTALYRIESRKILTIQYFINICSFWLNETKHKTIYFES